MRVLLVEDSRAMRNFIKDELNERGHDVVAYADAESALEAYSQNPFSLLVTDWILPGMSGLDLCMAIRAKKEGKRTIILMITSQSKSEDLEAVIEAGANDYIAKPFNRPLLQTRLRIVEGMVDNLMAQSVADEQLHQSVHEKAMVLKEMHSRVRSNMQVISSLLSITSRSITDTTAKDELNLTENRVRAMGLVHDRLYKFEDLTNFDLSDYVQALSVQLFRSYSVDPSRITFKANIDQSYVDINTMVPLGLMLNELITNSLRYSFPDQRKGSIVVSFNSDQADNLVLTVSDDGVVKNHKTSENLDTLGMRIIKALVGQIEGTLKRNEGEGTEFIVTFKKPVL